MGGIGGENVLVHSAKPPDALLKSTESAQKRRESAQKSTESARALILHR